MDTEKQLQAIEKELRLLKGELKQTLASLRDHLLNTGLLSSGLTAIVSKPKNGGGQPTMEEGSLPQSPTDKTAAISDGNPTDKSQPEIEEMFDETDPFMVIPDLSPEDTSSAYRQMIPGPDKSVPGVNMLANLISWISSARREIGDEQLSTLLEIYGISGNLSPDMKDIILNMATITSEKTGETSPATSWSNAMLALHGILTGSDTPLNPVKPLCKVNSQELDPAEKVIFKTSCEPQKNSIRLNLDLPHGGGEGKEYYINLTSEADSGGEGEQ